MSIIFENDFLWGYFYEIPKDLAMNELKSSV